MYVKEIKTRNIKLLHRGDLSFVRPDGSLRMWTLLVAVNGLCKTTLLRSIAMAAAGTDRANQLADVPSLPDRRRPEAVARVEADFSFDSNGHPKRFPGLPPSMREPPTVRSSLQIYPERKVFSGTSAYVGADVDREDPLGEAQGSALPGWFVAGYGVERQLPSPLTTRAIDDPLLTRLQPLFGVAPIIGTGFADFFEDDLARKFSGLVRVALVDSQLLPYVRNLELRGRGGVRRSSDLLEANRFILDAGEGKDPLRLPATWLSQGYQAMIAWVADLIGHALLENPELDSLSDITGLVLVDEIDLFLHPLWQITVVSTLKSVFPKVQFVATTHSPMVLPGLEQDEIFLLERRPDGDVEVAAAPAPPKLLTASEIYALFFDVESLYPDDLNLALRDYGALALNPLRSDADEAKLDVLKAFLEEHNVILEFDPVPRA